MEITGELGLACGQPLESGLHTEVLLLYVRLTEEVSIYNKLSELG